eukprot:UN10619
MTVDINCTNQCENDLRFCLDDCDSSSSTPPVSGLYGVSGLLVLLLMVNILCIGYVNCCKRSKMRYSKVDMMEIETHNEEVQCLK